MERTLVAINFPNFLTIGVMGLGFWLIAGLLWQTWQTYANKGA